MFQKSPLVALAGFEDGTSELCTGDVLVFWFCFSFYVIVVRDLSYSSNIPHLWAVPVDR